jgi:hypothetical protein
VAYNVLSGTVIAADKYLPAELTVNIVSGNLSTSDGSSVLNVPRVSNATNNAVLTNVGGDANTLVCESNLTFDGDTLNVVGEITASTGVSASFFMGDGSRLTGVTGGGGGNANAQGPLYSLQFTTGSGGVSGSAGLIFSSSILSVAGGLKLNRIGVNSSYIASTTDYYIGVDTSENANPITVGLPSASLLQDGQTYVIKDEGGHAEAKNVSIAAAGSDTIDGQNTIVLESPYAAIQLYCNGISKYYIC